MQELNGKKLIKDLYKYLNTNLNQVNDMKKPDYNSSTEAKSGYYHSIYMYEPEFEDKFSHDNYEKSKCPDIESLLSNVYFSRDNNNKTSNNSEKVTKHIKLLQDRLDKGTSLFSNYAAIINNEPVTVDNIINLLNKLIEFAYCDLIKIFNKKAIKSAKLKPSIYMKTIDVPEFRHTLFSQFVAHNKVLIYGPIGCGKTTLIKYFCNKYNLSDVCYEALDYTTFQKECEEKSTPLADVIKTLSDNYSDKVGKISLSSLERYNHSLLIIDNYNYSAEDDNSLKELFSYNISIFLVCREYNTVLALNDLKFKGSISDYTLIDFPDYPDNVLSDIVRIGYPQCSASMIRDILYYSARNPLLISLIASSIPVQAQEESTFDVLENFKLESKLSAFERSNSVEGKRSGQLLITGHIKNLYKNKISFLKSNNGIEKLSILFGIACFGWDNLPRSFITTIVALLNPTEDETHISSIIDELIEERYISNSSDEYLSISPLLGDVLFSQYSNFEKNATFTQKDIVKLYDALSSYFKCHHLLYSQIIIPHSIYVFISRTYRLINIADNSSKKTSNVTDNFDMIQLISIEAFNFCCQNGSPYYAEKILKTLNRLENYRNKFYASNSYSIYDYDILGLTGHMYSDLIYGTHQDYNKEITNLTDTLLSELKVNKENGVNPKDLNNFVFWRKKLISELGQYLAIDKTLLNIIISAYNLNFSKTTFYHYYNISNSLLAMRTHYKDIEDFDNEDVYATVVRKYINSFYNGCFEEINSPQNISEYECLDDFIYKLCVWISLKCFSIIAVDKSVHSWNIKFKEEIFPCINKVTILLNDRLKVIPIYLMISFLRVMQSTDILLRMINHHSKKEDRLTFPISKEDAYSICQKCNNYYSDYCLSIIEYTDKYLQELPDTAFELPQTE